MIKKEPCLRCMDMTKPKIRNKTICSKCKKPYKMTRKEYIKWSNKMKEKLNQLRYSEPDARAKADYFSVGGSDF